ncbi:Hypothetical predicted protein [Mytilus galloprovincialis]|uniref:Uncharacterized protein n=1 Tax=Mytilus galloprovincialis TaxID=29158 RepID=A0A8B6BMG4_MYTGA|nr:Hypothetical predicted protein [Mytilus galloprovincialis]
MEGKAVIIFFGFIACAFAVYSPKGGKACEIECSSHSECLDGYKCQTEGCDRMCRPGRVILSNAVVGSDIILAGCVQRCMDRGGLGCRSLCQRSVDPFSGGQLIPGGLLDRHTLPVGSIRSESLVRRISPVSSIRSDSLVRHISPVGSIRSDGLVGRISQVDLVLHKGCKNTCISRGCNFNEECVTRDGCSVCVRAKTYT